jgi:hypothetical protein
MMQNRKLTDYEVDLMRKMYRAKVWDGYKVTLKLLAECFLVSEVHAGRIVNEVARRSS